MKHKALILELDGAVADTAKYHYMAWSELASQLGIVYTPRDNERTKGMTRMQALEYMLEIGGRTATEEEKLRWCAEKNHTYLYCLRSIEEYDLRSGVRKFLSDCRAKGYLTAACSASRNMQLLMDRLDLWSLFDAVVDGNQITRSKPDPELYLRCADALGLDPADCIVFQDTHSGIAAAKAAGMANALIGRPEFFPGADYAFPAYDATTIEKIEETLSR